MGFIRKLFGGGSQVKFRPKRAPHIPLGLVDIDEAVQWFKPGDHPAVKEPPPGLMHADGRTTIGPGGMPYFIQEPVHGIIPGPDGDHIVKPGYWVLTNSDGAIWALSPQHMAEWFEEA